MATAKMYCESYRNSFKVVLKAHFIDCESIWRQYIKSTRESTSKLSAYTTNSNGCKNVLISFHFSRTESDFFLLFPLSCMYTAYGTRWKSSALKVLKQIIYLSILHDFPSSSRALIKNYMLGNNTAGIWTFKKLQSGIREFQKKF